MSRIVSTPDTLCGLPRIEGTRIAVATVLGCVDMGMTVTEILRDYPDLTAEDIDACVEWRNQNPRGNR